MAQGEAACCCLYSTDLPSLSYPGSSGMVCQGLLEFALKSLGTAACAGWACWWRSTARRTLWRAATSSRSLSPTSPCRLGALFTADASGSPCVGRKRSVLCMQRTSSIEDVRAASLVPAS